MNFGALSYGAAAVAFLLLTALLLTSWRGHSAGARLIFASAGTAIWAAVLAAAELWHVPALAIYASETVRDWIWLLALIGLGGSAVPRTLVRVTYAAMLALLVLAFIIPVSSAEPAVLLTRGGLAVALLGLVILEQIYRNSEPQVRHKLKWLVTGIGGLFVYDLFMYSQAELLRGIGAASWHARGIVYAAAVPVIAMAVKRNPEWNFDIFVSRHVVFYSATFVAVGSYLLLMALGGYYVRASSSSWGAVGQILFVTLATLLLLLLLFSDDLRRRAKVFINKHFYRNKYDYRVEWLRFIRTLSSTDEGDVRRTALRAVTQLIGSPGGALLTRDDTGRKFLPAAAWPLDLGSMPEIAEIRGDSDLASFLLQRQWIVDVEEYRQSPGIYLDMELPGWIAASPSLRIIVPMLGLDRLEGIFVLYGPPAPFELTYEDRDLLKTVSQHVATQIAQHEADRKLAEARQFEAYNKLTAFMMHDLKNSVAQLKLIVANAERHKRNPEFVDDAIGTIGNTVERMTRLIDQLRGANSSSVRVAALDELLAAAVQRCSGRLPAARMDAVPDSVWVRADIDRLAAVIEHVIRNAQDATADTGSVHCHLVSAGGEALLTVTDTGVGMAPEFVRDRLFRPFDSTKGAKGMGIGAYQVREYVRMLGGDIEVQSSPGSGTRFSIRLPVSPGPGGTPGTPIGSDVRAGVN